MAGETSQPSQTSITQGIPVRHADFSPDSVSSVTFVERDKLKEKCGITAWVSKFGKSVAAVTHEMQHLLNHRGEDNAGFATIGQDGLPERITKTGRVKTGFPTPNDLPQGDRIIGHNRYATSERPEFYQPVIATVDGHWLALAHNGNIPDEYREVLRERIPNEYRNKANFDSAELAYAIATAEGTNWKEKIKNGLKDIPMAYALTMLTDDGDIYGLVGPSGHWPLWLGETEEGIGLASETRAFPEGTTTRAIKPGELVRITPDGFEIEKIFLDLPQTYRCALHEVYGAKPDSRREDGELYGDLRKRLGREIALSQENPITGDNVVYIGIPTSGRFVAEGYVEALGGELTDVIRLSDEHIKNGTNGRERSFLAVTVEEMEQIANGKLAINPALAKKLKGKRAVIIDDSVIRGTTIKKAIKQLRNWGIVSADVISGLTQVERECKYGYNILRSQGLIALGGSGIRDRFRTNEEIAEVLGADSIYFAPVEIIKEVLGQNTCTECLHGGESLPLRRQLTTARVLVQNKLILSS